MSSPSTVSPVAEGLRRACHRAGLCACGLRLRRAGGQKQYSPVPGRGHGRADVFRLRPVRFRQPLGRGRGILSVIAAVFIVNLRYLLMSAAESPWLARLPRWQRFLLGLGLTDETFAVHITALQRGWKLSLTTLYLCNSTTHLAWVIGCAVGAFCGELVNDVRPLGLDYALTAMFLALLVPQCVSRLHVLVGPVHHGPVHRPQGAGMSQWNVAVATILGASLGVLLLYARRGPGLENPGAEQNAGTQAEHSDKPSAQPSEVRP